MTKVLLDTNIIIHRENDRVSNYDIGRLYYWIDRLKLTKVIHPLTEEEIGKCGDTKHLEVLKVKLQAYEKIYTRAVPTSDFYNYLKNFPEKTENDRVDNQFLYEVYSERVNMLITEDKRMRNKAKALGIGNKVFSIEQFINEATQKHPSLIEYKTLNVKPFRFGELDRRDPFFNSLRQSYSDFDNWLAKKSEEKVYACHDHTNHILGLLYLKIEEEDENYSDIVPIFSKKRRLKIGTFKTESTGFRLGERFLKITFDNAKRSDIDEIYVTMYPNVSGLKELLEQWGFTYWGKKGEEIVLIKDLKRYDLARTPLQNFPLTCTNCNKFILPIYSQYHTTLLPDSILNTEEPLDFITNIAHRYALRKIYITGASACPAKTGDLVVFYRIGDKEPKKYSSVLTSVGIIAQIRTNFRSESDFLKACENRTVFSKQDLQRWWRKYSQRLLVIDFLFQESFKKRIPLAVLWAENIVPAPKGPRPFHQLTDEQFDKIINKACE